MRIFVLGAGATGGLLAQILQYEGYRIVCGDRDPERARAFLGKRTRCVYANARTFDSIVKAARGCQLLVNTTPAVFNEIVLRAALRIRAHYLDMASHLERHPFKAEQLRFHDAFVKRKRLALINAGVAPGLSNLMVAVCAQRMSRIDKVRIRLFEETISNVPVSTWSAEVAFDEAVSPPRVYRNRTFALTRRFAQPERFRFQKPVGEARVFLAAQDEVATLPYWIEMNDLDVKIGGNDIDRMVRLFRKGALKPSRARTAKRFPDAASPLKVAEMLRSGKLTNARFAMAITLTGWRGKKHLERRRYCSFPTLRQLRSRRLRATPIAFAAATSAAAFIVNFPTHRVGVLPPEALTPERRRMIVRDMRRRGFKIRRMTLELDAPPEPKVSKKPSAAARTSASRKKSRR